MVINSGLNWKLHNFFAKQTMLTKNRIVSYDVFLQQQDCKKNRQQPISQFAIPYLDEIQNQVGIKDEDTLADAQNEDPLSKSSETTKAYSVTKIATFGSGSISHRRLVLKVPKNSIVFISLKSMLNNDRVTCSKLKSFISDLKQAACKISFFCEVSRKLGSKGFRTLSRKGISPTPRLNPNHIFILSRRTKKQDLVRAHKRIVQQLPGLKRTVIIIDEERDFLRGVKSSDFGCKKVRCFETSFHHSMEFTGQINTGQHDTTIARCTLKRTPNLKIAAANMREQTAVFKLARKTAEVSSLKEDLALANLENASSDTFKRTFGHLFEAVESSLPKKILSVKRKIQGIAFNSIADKKGNIHTV